MLLYNGDVGGEDRDWPCRGDTSSMDDNDRRSVSTFICLDYHVFVFLDTEKKLRSAKRMTLGGERGRTLTSSTTCLLMIRLGCRSHPLMLRLRVRLSATFG